MYVIMHEDEKAIPHLTCDSDLASAKRECQRWYDEGFASKVYLARDVAGYAAAKACIEMGSGEVIWSPTPSLTPQEQEKLSMKALMYELGLIDA